MENAIGFSTVSPKRTRSTSTSPHWARILRMSEILRAMSARLLLKSRGPRECRYGAAYAGWQVRPAAHAVGEIADGKIVSRSGNGRHIRRGDRRAHSHRHPGRRQRNGHRQVSVECRLAGIPLGEKSAVPRAKIHRPEQIAYHNRARRRARHLDIHPDLCRDFVPVQRGSVDSLRAAEGQLFADVS